MFAVIASIVFISCKKQQDNLQETHEPVDELAFTDAEKAIIFSNSSDTAMRVMNYFIYADSLILRANSRNVNLNDTTTLFYLIDIVYQTVHAEGGVGIAAPQVGINRNVIWVQRYDKGSGLNRPFEVYLNPVITRYSDTTKMKNDGCLSIPGIYQQSLRAIWVDVEYDLIDGTHKAERISHEYTAHIFQHEIDHLRGIVFLDRTQ